MPSWERRDRAYWATVGLAIMREDRSTKSISASVGRAGEARGTAEPSSIRPIPKRHAVVGAAVFCEGKRGPNVLPAGLHDHGSVARAFHPARNHNRQLSRDGPRPGVSLTPAERLLPPSVSTLVPGSRGCRSRGTPHQPRSPHSRACGRPEPYGARRSPLPGQPA
jgi:hypothetical protein